MKKGRETGMEVVAESLDVDKKEGEEKMEKRKGKREGEKGGRKGIMM